MTNGRHGEELRLIARLKGLGDLRAETREELGWIEADLREGNATGEDLRYLRALAADRLGEAGQARAAVAAGKALRICFIGDSITAGTGDDMFQGWAGRLCEMAFDDGHDVTGYNLGVRSETSAMIAARWRAECAPRLPGDVPAALVFAFGVNDTAEEPEAGRRASLEDSLATARAILEAAKSWHPTLWIGPAPVLVERQPVSPRPGVTYDFRNERVAELNAAYAELAAELTLPYLDLFTPLSGEPEWAEDLAAGDGIHPTAEGYERMAELIEEWAGWRGLFK